MRHRLLPILAFAAALLLSAASSEETDFVAPWFCHGLDCPVYAVVETTPDYEARRYEKSKWMSTTVDGLSFREAREIGFQRLFDYIDGENAEEVEIAMTTPVRTSVIPGDGPFCKSSFTVSFFVPFKYTDNPPEPTSELIFVDETPALTAYVVGFDGWLDEDQMVREASALIEKLRAKGIDVQTNLYYNAAYDPPFRLTDRHTEIWILGKEPTT